MYVYVLFCAGNVYLCIVLLLCLLNMHSIPSLHLLMVCVGVLSALYKTQNWLWACCSICYMQAWWFSLSPAYLLPSQHNTPQSPIST